MPPSQASRPWQPVPGLEAAQATAQDAGSTSVPLFVLFTTPMNLARLPNDSNTCSLCMEPYGEYIPSTPNLNDSQPEWAVRVDLAAAQDGSTRCCGHIFGRRCLERHLKSAGRWHNKCPLCRAVWFTSPVFDPPTPPRLLPPPRPRSGSAALSALATASIPSNLTWRTTAALRARLQDEEFRRDQDLSNRLRLQRSVNFIQQVLERFSVVDGSEEVKASVEEVETVLEQLYESLEIDE